MSSGEGTVQYRKFPIYWQPIGYRPLTLDVYLPPPGVQRPAASFPLIVHIHGGGWMIGDSHLSGPFVDFPGVLASLSARGYVVASIDYRLSSEAAFPANVQDVMQPFDGYGPGRQITGSNADQVRTNLRQRGVQTTPSTDSQALCLRATKSVVCSLPLA